MTAPALPVVFTRRAARQIEQANHWWRANRSAAPNAVVEELGVILPLVVRQPRCGLLTRKSRLPGVRRVLLPRVAYFLYYRVVAPKRRLEVVAFWHAKRGSEPRL